MRTVLGFLLVVCSVGGTAAFTPTLLLCPSLRTSTSRHGSMPAVHPSSKLRLALRSRASASPLALRMDAADVVVEDGDVVGVFYKGTLDDDSVFDENPGGPPLEFEVGSGRVIQGFDEAVRGLKVGESRKVRCEPKNAYGDIDESNVAEVPKDQMPTPPPECLWISVWSYS